MPVFQLDPNSVAFPHPSFAREDGILAVGGDLSPERLLLAYQHGIFPWYSEGDPILWWSPDPRFVLFPDELKVSRSMRPYFNQQKFTVSYDQQFATVMKNCALADRRGQFGTWITQEMVKAYCNLHDLGYAHSVEVWEDQQLIGGLYGISIGKIFFGESMFTKVSNASKFGFISLVRALQQYEFDLIDCQQETKHLESLGARSITRKKFLRILEENTAKPTLKGNWNDLLNTEI